jgi:hypothetical protein
MLKILLVGICKIGSLKKNAKFFAEKLAKNAENCYHNIDPWCNPKLQRALKQGNMYPEGDTYFKYH